LSRTSNVLYVTVATSRRCWAEGYKAGLEAGDYAPEIVIDVRDDVPPDKVFLTSERIPETPE